MPVLAASTCAKIRRCQNTAASTSGHCGSTAPLASYDFLLLFCSGELIVLGGITVVSRYKVGEPSSR